MIEPTETERTLDQFIEAMKAIAREARENPCARRRTPRPSSDWTGRRGAQPVLCAARHLPGPTPSNGGGAGQEPNENEGARHTAGRL